MESQPNVSITNECLLRHIASVEGDVKSKARHFFICKEVLRVGGEKTAWKAERAWLLDRRKKRVKPGIEPLLTDLWPSSWTQISESSKGACSFSRRAGFSIPPEKGRQGASMELSSRRNGKSEAFPPPRSRWGKSGVFLNYPA